MDSATSTTLAEQVKARRRRAGVSRARLAALAAEAGKRLDPSTIFNIEHGRQKNPQLTTLEAVAVALSRALGEDVKVSDLTGDTQEPEPEPFRKVAAG